MDLSSFLLRFAIGEPAPCKAFIQSVLWFAVRKPVRAGLFPDTAGPIRMINKSAVISWHMYQISYRKEGILRGIPSFLLIYSYAAPPR